jgi:hypothetical protein
MKVECVSLNDAFVTSSAKGPWAFKFLLLILRAAFWRLATDEMKAEYDTGSVSACLF